MTEKHTPKPWKICETATHITVLGANNEAIFHDDKRIPCVIQDAHLISAAPILLEVLENCIGNINPERGFADELEAEINAAIRAARRQA